MKSLFVRDQILFRHHRRCLALKTTYPESCRNEAAQLGIPPDHLRQPLSLVGGQRVHRIDKDRLDSSPPALPEAMIENRIEKALRLAGPRPGCDNRGLAHARVQPLPCLLLVPIRRETRWKNFRERTRSVIRWYERQLHRQVGAAKKDPWLSEQLFQSPGEEWISDRERREEEVLHAPPDLTRDDGRDQTTSCTSRTMATQARYRSSTSRRPCPR